MASAEYEQFLTTVAQKARISWEAAERAARAALMTLAERLSAGQARDIAAQLPAELAPWLATQSGAEPFDADEFVRRVAKREGTDLASATRHAQAVFTALGRIVGQDEIEDMAAELPKDFAPFVAEAEQRFVDIVPFEEFVRRVADRAGVDEQGARHATDAVLETLAERIAGGEVEDLIEQLPGELHAPLKRGDELSNGAARRMSVDEFVRRIAEREGVTPEEAHEHARAVFATLREAIPEHEFLDVLAQLPRDYAALEARP